MKNSHFPAVLTFLGYLICISPLFWKDLFDIMGMLWIGGISLHVLASLIFSVREYPAWKKFMYFLLPVPLGFVMTIWMVMACNMLFGWWH